MLSGVLLIRPIRLKLCWDLHEVIMYATKQTGEPPLLHETEYLYTSSSSEMGFKDMSDLCHRSVPPSPAHSCTAMAADRNRADSRASARSGRNDRHPTQGHTWRHGNMVT